MKLRLAVLTEIIAPYRIPVFNALAKVSDLDPHVVFLAKTDSTMRQWRIYADEMRFSYEVLPSWRCRFAQYNLLVNQSVTSVLQKVDPDVVLCGGYNYLASWQAMRWARRNHVPFLVWSESTAADHRRKHWLVESLKHNFLNHCDGFVVPGKSALEYMQQVAISPGRIFVAPNAVDIDLFSAGEKAARAQEERLRSELGLPLRYFLFVGRLVKSKGVIDLLEAYNRLSPDLRANLGLVFVGDGTHRAELESRARSILPGTVHFAGFVHRDELANYYGLAECFVFPTHSDPWGLVVNEAMACGLPVICTNVAGCAADLVKANGRAVAPRDLQQLATAMQEVATDPYLRARMSRHSRDLIQGYSPQACATGIAEAAFSASRGRSDVCGLWGRTPPRADHIRRADVTE